MLLARMKTSSKKTAGFAEIRQPPGAREDIPPLPDDFPRTLPPMKRDWVWWSLAAGFSGMGTAFLALLWMTRYLF